MRRTQVPFRCERGVAAVEFALIAIVFFTLLLGIMELGRLLYLWNTVQEVTRHAAREAVVRAFSTSDTDAVRREAMFRPGSAGTVYLPAGPEISDAEVRISYLYDTVPTHVVDITTTSPKENLSYCKANDPTMCIRYVRAEVCTATGCGEVLYQPMVGFLLGAGGIDFAVAIPISPVVMPAEALGFTPS